jgi:hypothetical protein
MVERRRLEMARAAATDAEQFCGLYIALSCAADASEALLQGDGDGAGHGLAGFVGECLCKLVSLGIFDVQAHVSTIADYILPFYHRRQ